MMIPTNQVIAGDCLEVMRDFPCESANLVMFSPPYWGLRDYDVEGQIGLEQTYQEYVKKMVEVGREVKRVLKKDGSWYLNLGDTYAGSGCGAQHGWADYKREKVKGIMNEPSPQTKMKGLEKCKLLIPYRVALALMDDGWICRNDITWFKPNAMPSSVKDRLTCHTERIFHLVKSKKYYYDLDAIREQHKYKDDRPRTVNGKPNSSKQYSSGKLGFVSEDTRLSNNPLGKNPGDVVKQDSVPGQTPQSIRKHSGYFGANGEPSVDFDKGKNPGDVIDTKQVISPHRVGSDKEWMQAPKWEREGGSAGYHELGRNPGDFWPITTKPFPEAHFAVYPEALCEKPIKSSCPKDGIVLDPMCGAGTTLVVAKRLGRRWIGIDLNRDYCEMARKRLSQVESPLDVYSGHRTEGEN